MNQLSSATRVSLGLTCLTLVALFVAEFLGLLPDLSQEELDGRRKVCEAAAISCSIACKNNDTEAMSALLEALVHRNADTLSAGVRGLEGKLLVATSEHERLWDARPGDRSSPTHAKVPIIRNDERWGTVEIHFRPLKEGGVLGGHILRLFGFVAAIGFLGYLLYLRKTFQHLDPASVIPERVQSMLDVLAEGVLVLDKKERIVLANEGFTRVFRQSASELQGRPASALQWKLAGPDRKESSFPWLQTLADGSTRKGERLQLATEAESTSAFMVNSAPILGGDRKVRGAMVTFDDITDVEAQNCQLQEAIALLEQSRDEVRQQNEKLQFLATRDSLTGCLNRRSFFEKLDADWSSAQRHRHPMACIMMDVDHFKSVNDTYGHSVGDVVLRKVADVMQSLARKDEMVCRYGGEEFCIVLPHGTAEEAALTAERLRATIESEDYSGVPVTMSFGVSSTELGAASLQELLDQADQALYRAKRCGRNCVVRYDKTPTDGPIGGGASGRTATPLEKTVLPIPIHAVNALMSALAHRDISTAEHSREAAELCLTVAQGLMSPRDCFILEIGAQLHDIGKLGLPDSILLKPAELSEDERKIMACHERLGTDVIESAFSCPELTEIVRNHHAHYGGRPDSPYLPAGDAIPLGARILAIADAFSAMISHRPYRKALTQEAALAELRRCAGTQFDPALVERFAEVVGASDKYRVDEDGVSSPASRLRIGRDLDGLAAALDTSDLPTLATIAARVAITALKHDAAQIAQLASELQFTASSNTPDMLRVVQLTTSLLNVGRSPGNKDLRKLDCEPVG